MVSVFPSHILIFSQSYKIDPKIKELSEQKIHEWRQWFDNRLDDAIQTADRQHNALNECRSTFRWFSILKKKKSKFINLISFYFLTFNF